MSITAHQRFKVARAGGIARALANAIDSGDDYEIDQLEVAAAKLPVETTEDAAAALLIAFDEVANGGPAERGVACQRILAAAQHLVAASATPHLERVANFYTG